MTAWAVAGTQAPARVVGVASTAVHGLVTVPRTATVLGTSGYAVWLAIAGSVVVVSTRDATRLPNGVEIAANAGDDLFAKVHHGATIDVGFSRIMLEGLAVQVVRWWDPRPALPKVTPLRLAEAVAGLPAERSSVPAQGLRQALTSYSPHALLAAAKPLLGRGPGLTPEGDDYLAGAIAGWRLLGEALELQQAGRMLDRSAHPLAALADARTTTFSAALIHNALRGQVAQPAGRFLAALCGRGDVAIAHQELCRIGHSSGPALAAGIVLGAQVLIHSIAQPDRRTS